MKEFIQEKNLTDAKNVTNVSFKEMLFLIMKKIRRAVCDNEKTKNYFSYFIEILT